MTTGRDFKRLVRTRMRKTGESYTAARAALLRQPHARPAALAPGAVAAAPPPPDYAKLAGMSDAAVKARTGCTWEKWVYVLDKARAVEKTHPEIVALVRKYKVGPWWGQMVAVGYERIRGLRARGQRRNGSFEINKSKTVGRPLTAVYQAFARKRLRDQWLTGASFEVRSTRPRKAFRMNWADGSSVEVLFVSKGRAKSQVTVQHMRLPDQAAATRLRAFWAERLEALAGLE